MERERKGGIFALCLLCSTKTVQAKRFVRFPGNCDVPISVPESADQLRRIGRDVDGAADEADDAAGPDQPHFDRFEPRKIGEQHPDKFYYFYIYIYYFILFIIYYFSFPTN
jgi:hypothetical protein